MKAFDIMLQFFAVGLPMVRGHFETLHRAEKIRDMYIDALENSSLENVVAFRFTDDHEIQFVIGLPMYSACSLISIAKSNQIDAAQKAYWESVEGKVVGFGRTQ
jgi:hypothetical protein